jgi:copper chaperone
MNQFRQQILLNIHGMNCGSCVRHVEGALKSVTGVESVSVYLASGRAEVRGTGLTTAILLSAIEEEGYSAEVASQA